jgi:hypothetical protein
MTLKKLPGVLAVACLPLAAVVALDYLTGQSLSFTFFYVVVTVFAAIYGRTLGGTICALCATVATLFLELHTSDPHWLVVLWNTGTRLAVLMTIVVVLGPILWLRSKAERGQS